MGLDDIFELFGRGRRKHHGRDRYGHHGDRGWQEEGGPERARGIRCSSCGVQVSSGAKFCPQCGATLAPGSCAACGAALAAGAKFCAQCGQPQS